MQPSGAYGAVDSFFTRIRQASRIPANTKTPKVSSSASGSDVPPLDTSPGAQAPLRGFLAADRPNLRLQSTKNP